MKIDDHFIACCSHSVFSCFFMFSVGEPPGFWTYHGYPMTTLAQSKMIQLGALDVVLKLLQWGTLVTLGDGASVM